MKYVREPSSKIDIEAIKLRLDNALTELTVRSLLDSLIDVRMLLVEIDDLRWREWEHRREFADMLAAARASIAAGVDDEPNPMVELRSLVHLHSAITDNELDEWRDLDRFRRLVSKNSDPDQKEAMTN
jgi:hypothetical protein